MLVHVAGLAAGGLDGFRRGAFRHRDQDVGQAVLFGKLDLAEVGGEEVLHFLVGDLDAFGDAALTHAADDHLAANLVARIVEGQAVACQRLLELVEGQVVALGDGGHRLVQFLVGDTHAGAFADLHLQILEDQAFQHLLGQHIAGRHLRAALGDGLLDFAHALVELALHHHVVVDDGDHAVQGYYFRTGQGAHQQGAQHERAQTVTEHFLHVDGSLRCLGRGSLRLGCRPRHQGLSG
ncbi:hypothetical protein D3C78_640340 [compost metagenome]